MGLTSRGNIMAIVPSDVVLLSVDERYSDDAGAYIVLHVMHPDTLEVTTIGGAYDSIERHQIKGMTLASEAQRQVAAEIYANSCRDLCAKQGHALYIGCMVVLARSRKAPNKTPLKVVDHKDRRWNGYNYDPEQVKVELPDGSMVWVGYSCIVSAVRGKLPYWAI